MAKVFVLDENKKILLTSAAIALVTLLIFFNIMKISTNNIRRLHTETAEEKKKLALRKDIVKIDEITKAYRNHLYTGKSVVFLRDALSDLAIKSGVDIISMQPLESESLGDFTKISFLLRLRCSYNQLGKFIANLEAFPSLISINDITVNPITEYSFRGGRESNLSMQETRAEASVLISTFYPAR